MPNIDTITDVKEAQTSPPTVPGEQRYCYHCGEAVPESLALYIQIDNEDRPMCCVGCEAVARAIIDYGLQDYYKFRTTSANKPDELIPEQLRRLAAYDDVVVQQNLLESEHEKLKSISLLLADMNCPACVWLIESRLSKMQGIISIKVNYSTQRARVQWDASRCRLSDILHSIAILGYRARPYDISQGHKQLNAEQKNQFRRLGLAGVLGMQVMMISVALYVGDWSGMEQKYRTFFYWVSLLLTTPVILYCAQPFFSRAWRDLRLFRTGMDVPVSLGILIAYINSIWATVTAGGHVYYDSIVMFVFFLLSARYFEFRARRRSALYIDTIGQIIPAITTRLVQEKSGSRQESVAVASLELNDILLIRPGDVIPVDGYLLEGETTVDEALLTGESKAVLKTTGDRLIGGSSNIEQPVKMCVTRIGKDTTCSHIYRLMEQGQRFKPELIALSDRVSAWFVFAVLMLAGLTAWYWYYHEASMWVPVTISVLVVSCPCALSLATPLALATASTNLMKQGVVLVNANALEALNKVTHYVFDKTGTLTRGRLTIKEIVTSSSMSKKQCIAIAAAMEANSSHPVAKAFAERTQSSNQQIAERLTNHPGLGISAEIKDKHYYLGTEKFIEQETGLRLKPESLLPDAAANNTYVFFADSEKLLCLFVLQDTIRDGAKTLIEYLADSKKAVSVLSGDNAQTTRALAEYLGLKDAYDSQSPESKMEYIKALRESGARVAMTGDGINDAPVLACADVAIAMGDGTGLASAHADLILLNSRLDKLIFVIEFAAHTKGIIQQNISWAIAYNLVALPLAVMGMVTPWMAALGMSLSSLIVVINSGRLFRIRN